jgi:hypothetical protein
MWFRRKKKCATCYEDSLQPHDKDCPNRIPPPAKKGFQVGDRVIVVRFPNDDHDTVADFEDVYGRIGEIAAVIQDHEDSVYDYTVRFPGWWKGWAPGEESGDGCHWGVYHRNLRRVVSKSDERPA